MSSEGIVVREVGPRDGLQSIAQVLPPTQKVRLLEELASAGLTRIEVGSLVSPQAVPQMADTLDVLARWDRSTASAEILVSHAKFAEAAAASGAEVVVGLLSASETFNAKNVRTSVAGSIEHLGVLARAVERSTRCVSTISAAFGCAYEGPVPIRAVLQVIERAAEHVSEVMLCDTAGLASPSAVEALVSAAVHSFGPDITFGLHLHDTRGLGLVNVAAGVQCGIRLLDSSVGGLGGCPYSPGATGNVCTEDLVHLLLLEGFDVGVDLEALAAVSRRLEAELGVTLPGALMRSGPVPDLRRINSQS